MALTAEDIEALGQLIDNKVKAAVGDVKADVEGMVAEANKPVVHSNDELQNQPENQPDYYLHLADGSVQVSKDSAGTHALNPETGKTEMVIGRYPVGSEV